MTVSVVFETHSTTVDNEQGRATGWLPGQLSERGWAGQRVLVIGHVATGWGLDHWLAGVPLEQLVAEDFAWREGWEYELG